MEGASSTRVGEGEAFNRTKKKCFKASYIEGICLGFWETAHLPHA